MNFINSLIDTYNIPALSVFLLGILTAVTQSNFMNCDENIKVSIFHKLQYFLI